MAQNVDQKQLRKLLAEKLPQREIARRLNIARSTLQRMIKGMDAPASAQASAQASASDSGNGLPVVDTGKLTPAEADAVRTDFWELIEWWRERRVQRAQDSTPRETARQTFHVETRFIRLIHREAEAEGVSITEVVNLAFRAYFEEKRRG